MKFGRGWIPSNNISVFDLPDGVYSCNPNLLPLQVKKLCSDYIIASASFSEYGSLFISRQNNTYIFVIYIDVNGQMATLVAYDSSATNVRWVIHEDTEPTLLEASYKSDYISNTPKILRHHRTAMPATPIQIVKSYTAYETLFTVPSYCHPDDTKYGILQNVNNASKHYVARIVAGGQVTCTSSLSDADAGWYSLIIVPWKIKLSN